ncbi:MAG: DUF2892 domain-containing protein [Gallionellaceae bacterium]|nr:DUF2892 domain-containing protein [Gallionellaceae bacterium]
MNAERIVRIVAGFFILLSLALGVEASPLFVSNNFLWFTAFVGLNLFQSGFTKFCLLNRLLTKLGVKDSWHSVKRKNHSQATQPFLPLQGEG